MQPEQPKHTPTPWEVKGGKIGKKWNDEFISVAVVQSPAWHENPRKGDEEADANAAFIVRAVNAHEELLEALKAIERLDSRYGYLTMAKACSDEVAHVRGLVRQAIAKAEGKETSHA